VFIIVRLTRLTLWTFVYCAFEMIKLKRYIIIIIRYNDEVFSRKGVDRKQSYEPNNKRI